MAEQKQQGGDNKAEAALGNKRKKLLLMGGVIAVLLLVCGAGTWAALHFLDDKKLGDKKPQAETAQGEGAEAAAPAAKPALYLQLDPNFLANYNVNGRQRYLQVALTVMTRDPAALDALREHMPLVRNRLVMLLSGETFEQLQTDEGRVQLQQKLLAAIREILQQETGKADIEQVLFTHFVMT